ncbi:MAG: transcriptional regulator [Planctomycetota bacterium]|nr:MAG: transcriptional regulator [Planctomycetota bacterium]
MRALPLDAKAVASLDKVLHEPARLSLVACLSLVEEADFVFLQSQTGMTGGNLSSHVRKLEQAQYIGIRKEFQGTRPRTILQLTDVGRQALETYLNLMRSLLAVMDQATAEPPS